MVLYKYVKTLIKKFDPSEILLSLAEFLHSYNNNLPESFPKASTSLLLKYKGEHKAFFKHADQWSLAEHRKKVMDWLPLNSEKA
jgi:hypothetical protein